MRVLVRFDLLKEPNLDQLLLPKSLDSMDLVDQPLSSKLVCGSNLDEAGDRLVRIFTSNKSNSGYQIDSVNALDDRPLSSSVFFYNVVILSSSKNFEYFHQTNQRLAID